MKQSKYLDKHIPSLEGKNFLITGSSSGVGLEAAKSLLYKKGTVYFAVRNETKTQGVITKIKEEIPYADCKILLFDQSQKESIINLVNSLPNVTFDAIILNAAIYFPKEGSVSKDNISLTFATNAIGTFFLYENLKKKCPKSRFVFVNSIANMTPKGRDFSSCLKLGNYKRGKEYAVSKRAIMNIFGHALENDKDIFVTMTHPGISATNILGNGYTPLFKKIGNAFLYLTVHKPWKACLGEVVLAAGENIKRGDYLVPRGLGHISGYPKKVKLPKKRTFRESSSIYKELSKLI